MKHYKLREGENIRKPVVKRDRIEIHVPVLLICLALAFLVWLYVVSISKLKDTLPGVETEPATETVAADTVSDPRDEASAAAAHEEVSDTLWVTGSTPASL